MGYKEWCKWLQKECENRRNNHRSLEKRYTIISYVFLVPMLLINCSFGVINSSINSSNADGTILNYVVSGVLILNMFVSGLNKSLKLDKKLVYHGEKKVEYARLNTKAVKYSSLYDISNKDAIEKKITSLHELLMKTIKYDKGTSIASVNFSANGDDKDSEAPELSELHVELEN